MRRALPILTEVILVICIIGIIVATWLPIEAFRTWLSHPF
jgi:hypothetical protein